MTGSTAENGEVARRTAITALGVLLLIATAARLHELGAGLWFDEIQTLVSQAGEPLSEIVTRYGSRNNHVLHSVLVGASTAAFGETVWALRLPAAVFGIASVAALYAFGVVVTTRGEALAATALATVSYHHVWFSQNARGYTMLLFFVLIGSACFLELLRGSPDRNRWLALYAASMALASYTHLTGAIVVVAHGVIWIARAWADARVPDRSVSWSPALAVSGAALGALLLYLPMLPSVLDLAPTVGPGKRAIGAGTGWTSPVWMALETARGLQRAAPGGLVALLVGGAVGIVGLVDYARRDRTVAALFVLPAAFVLAATLAMGHFLWPRLVFFSIGFAFLAFTRGAYATARASGTRHWRKAGTIFLALAALASAARLPAVWGPKQDYEAAAAFVEERRAEGDAVVPLSLASVAYRDRQGWFAGGTALSALEAIERRHDRTWVLYTFPDALAAAHPRTWERIRDEYRPMASFSGTLNGGDVHVRVRP